MAVYIDSAYFGDEKAMRNVTDILSDKILGTTIDVDVNEKLIPPFAVTNKVEITSLEEKKIRDQASRQCGGVDQECITATISRMTQERLKEKEMENNSSANVIKGRRLTINIIDEKGQRRRVVIPDGQKFKMDNISTRNPRTGQDVPPMEYIRNQMYLLGGLIFATFVYVFGIVATFTIFYQRFEYLAIPLVVISIFVPYSGYLMIFLFYMFESLAKTYVEK
jgi:hypothetical protein